MFYTTRDQGQRAAIKHWLTLPRRQRRDAVRAASSRSAPQLPADPEIRSALRAWIDLVHPKWNIWGLAIVAATLVAQISIDRKVHRDWAWVLFVCLAITLVVGVWDAMRAHRIRRTFRAIEAHES
jgi:hypothetical protein